MASCSAAAPDARVLHRLLAEQAEMKAELTLLQQCLQLRGILNDSDLHRQRFEGVKRRSGWTKSLCSLEEVMLPVAGNWPCWGQLRWASRRLHQNLAPVEARPEWCLYVVGGFAGQGNREASAECLHPTQAGGLWEAVPPMRTTRSSHAGAALGGWLYVCGGIDDNGPSSAVAKFSPASNLWAAAPSMWEARSRPAAVALHGRLCVCGGFDDQGILDSLECLYPEYGEWEQMEAMKTPRFAFAGVALRGQLFVFGGAENRAGNPVQSVEAFSDTSSVHPGKFLHGNWRLRPRMEQACCYHAAVTYGGCAYVCGGQGRGGAMDAVQCYNPDTNLWSQGPSMLRPRHRHAAAVIAGHLYIFGGKVPEHRGVESSVERLVLRGGRWESAEPMAQRRQDFCAAALPSRGLEP